MLSDQRRQVLARNTVRMWSKRACVWYDSGSRRQAPPQRREGVDPCHGHWRLRPLACWTLAITLLFPTSGLLTATGRLTLRTPSCRREGALGHLKIFLTAVLAVAPLMPSGSRLCHER